MANAVKEDWIRNILGLMKEPHISSICICVDLDMHLYSNEGNISKLVVELYGLKPKANIFGDCLQQQQQ